MTLLAIANINTVSQPQGFPENATTSNLGRDMVDSISDESLMIQYQRGDNKAFDQLFSRHKDAIFRYLERQCAQSAEEIFQDVWMKLIQARHQFRTDPSSRFKTYLYRIAHNRLMDHFRHNSVKNRVISHQPVDIDEMEHPGHRASTNPVDQVDTHRKLEKLLLLIQELPREQREAFLLKEESGCSIQEIAEITDVSRETAKSRLRYAFDRIRSGMRGLR